MNKPARAKKQPRKTDRAPVPRIFQLAYGVKVTTLAFKRQDAVRQTKAMFAALADTINAAGGPALEMASPKLLVVKDVGPLAVKE